MKCFCDRLGEARLFREAWRKDSGKRHPAFVTLLPTLSVLATLLRRAHLNQAFYLLILFYISNKKKLLIERHSNQGYALC